MKNFKFLSKIPTFEDEIPEGFEFAGVTPLLYSAFTFTPVRFILIRNLVTDTIERGVEINENHPLWDLIETNI